MYYENNLDFAKALDAKDALRGFREKFHFPKKNGKEVIYFCGNSCGLMPKTTPGYIQQELDDWATLAVEAHLQAKNPWYSYHEMFAAPLAEIAGAKPTEVVAMNALTVNLHLMMVSFYRPTPQRHKILHEAHCFPSDKYAMDSQARYHGFEPRETVVGMQPREGEYTLRTEDIIAKIEELGSGLALVLFPGVQYYSGQAFDLNAITAAAHRVGAVTGFDLAHAIGNIKLHLHDWNVDFACWCTYKYLNSGAGGVGGAFIHEKHAAEKDIPRFAGWWGHDKAERFKMQPDFKPIPTAEAWQLSNAPLLAMAAHKAALDIFMEAKMERLCEKRELLTGYLEFVLQQTSPELEIITPPAPERGAQLSVIARGMGRELHEKLGAAGIITDWREPNVIRMAPAPMYNSFEEVWLFGQALKKIIEH